MARRKRHEESQPTEAAASEPVERAGARRYTLVEVAQQEALVENLINTPGVTKSQAIRIANERLGIGQVRFETLRQRILQRYSKEDEAQGKRGEDRALAIRRIMAMLNHARGERTNDGRDWKRKPDHGAVARYEKLLADLQGTRMPIEVNVHHTVSTALQNVIGNLSEEQVQKYYDEYMETKRLADERRAELAERNVSAAE